MRLTHLLTVPAAAGAIILLGMSSASAGEINGTGNPPGGQGLGAAHANSVCAFSGLEDGDGAGFPGPGGAPPQNWGHVKQGARAAGLPAEVIASFRPGISCNPTKGEPVEP